MGRWGAAASAAVVATQLLLLGAGSLAAPGDLLSAALSGSLPPQRVLVASAMLVAAASLLAADGATQALLGGSALAVAVLWRVLGLEEWLASSAVLLLLAAGVSASWLPAGAPLALAAALHLLRIEHSSLIDAALAAASALLAAAAPRRGRRSAPKRVEAQRPQSLQSSSPSRPSWCSRLSEWVRVAAEEPRRLEECVRGRSVYGYLLEEVLGAGSFGVVFRGRDRVRGTLAALKLFLPQPQPGAGTVTRSLEEVLQELLAEGDALRRLSVESPFILELKAIHVDLERFRYAVRLNDAEAYLEAPPALVMEYAAGGSLRDLLGRVEGASPRSRWWRLVVYAALAPVAEALSVVHSAGYIHSDVKPGNMLLTAKPSGYDAETLAYELRRGYETRGLMGVLVKLGDLGSAVRQGAPLRGFTPLYAAPEVLRADSEGRVPRAHWSQDIYSLGVVATQLLLVVDSGRLAKWRAEGMLEPSRVEKLLASRGVEVEAARLVARMLSSNPAERPAAREVAATLRKLL